MNDSAQVQKPTLLPNTKISIDSCGDVTIKRVTARTIKPVVEYLTTILGSLESAGVSAHTFTATPALVLQLISQHMDSTLAMVCVFSSLERETVDDLPLDELVVVVLAIVRENYRFFTERLAPLLTEVESGAFLQTVKP